MPIRRFTSFLWWFFTKDGDPKEVTKFKNRLWIPPKGVAIPKSSPWSAEKEREAFQAFAVQVTGKKVDPASK